MKQFFMMAGTLLVASALGCSGGNESAAPQTPAEQPVVNDTAQPVENRAEEPVEVTFLVSGML
jgi:hypothetical protein